MMLQRFSFSLRQSSRRNQRNVNRNGKEKESFKVKGIYEKGFNSSQWKGFASSNVPEKSQHQSNKGLKSHPDEEAEREDVIEFQKPYQPPPKITMEEYFPHLAFEKQVLKERAQKQKQIEESMAPHEEHDEDHHDDHGHVAHKDGGHHGHVAHTEHHGDHHGHAAEHHHHDAAHHHDDHHGHGNYEHHAHGDSDHPDLNAQKKPEYSTMTEPFIIACALACALTAIPFDRSDEFKETWNPFVLFKKTYSEPLPVTDTRGLPLHIVPIAPSLYEKEYFRDKIVRAELDGPFGKKLEEALQKVQEIRERDKKVADAANSSRTSSHH